MTVSQIKQNLEKYGLNQREVAIYLSLLKDKDQTVFNLSKNTQFPRTTVYKDLESLKEKGLVGIFKKNKVAHWYSEHPRRLIKDAENKVESIKEVFPELESLFSMNNEFQPEVRFYTGKECIKEIINNFYEILENRDVRRLYTISHPNLHNFYPKFLPEVLKRKNELKIFTHLIAPSSVKNLNFSSYTDDEFREVRYLDDKYFFTSTMIICDEHIALFSLKNNDVYAMTITSHDFSEMFKAMFMSIWNSLDNVK